MSSTRDITMTATIALPIGTAVIHYNKWTGFETGEFKGQFQALSSKEDFQKLKVGDEVYVDIDPLHRNGKVYGCVKANITEVETLPNNKFRIHYRGGAWKGFKTVACGVYSDFAVAHDEAALATIVARLPLSTVIEK